MLAIKLVPRQSAQSWYACFELLSAKGVTVKIENQIMGWFLFFSVFF